MDFRANWLDGGYEIGKLPWVPFVCIAKFTDSLADRDWAEGGHFGRCGTAGARSEL